jgi:transcriptional regulator
MYLPPQFREDDVSALHAAIRQIGFGTLVTLGADGLIASHVPMLIDPAPTPHGTLIGHVARANPQWRGPASAVEALAMFVGPNGYVTPSWYPTKRETGKVVPTWNYIAIHAYGPVEFFEDPDRLLGVVTRLTETHEAPRAAPWAVSDAPAEFVRAQLKGIVGFSLPISRLEGKWKMSQNRTPADLAGVREGLAREPGPVNDAVAAVMAAREPTDR